MTSPRRQRAGGPGPASRPPRTASTARDQRCRGPKVAYGAAAAPAVVERAGAGRVPARPARCGGSAPWAAARRASAGVSRWPVGRPGSATAGRPASSSSPAGRAGPARRRCPRRAARPGPARRSSSPRPRRPRASSYWRSTLSARTTTGRRPASSKPPRREGQPRRVGGGLRRRPPGPGRSPARPPGRPADGGASRAAQLDRGDRGGAVAEVDHQRVGGGAQQVRRSAAAIQLSTRRSRFGLVVPRVIAPSGRVRPRSATVTDAATRCTLCWAAWASGRTTSRSTLTWCGRVAHQATQSAMSSATSGSATPA